MITVSVRGCINNIVHVKLGELGETPLGQYRSKQGVAMRGKPMTLRVTVDGCIVSTSHKTNKDGYLRIRGDRVTGAGRKPLIMAHRLVWEKIHGEIPEGHEVDHICGTRGCINECHLQVLSRAAHLDKTNRDRYAVRKADAMKHWKSTKCTGSALSALFDVSFSIACRWIREWRSRDYP